MDHTDLLQTLAVERRLALAYAPASARTLTLGLMALDARLRSVVQQAREPLLGQMRLAWWRDRLESADTTETPGEPLLALLKPWGSQSPGLGALVDGWEHLLTPDPLDRPAMERFIEARGAACAALARCLQLEQAAGEAQRAGQGWAATDLALRLSDEGETERARALAASLDWAPVRLPRSLRPLAVLHGLARRERGQGGFLTGGLAGLAAIRLGLIGF